MTEQEFYTGQRVIAVEDGDKGTIVNISEDDYHTAGTPSVHTVEKTYTVHFDDKSICKFRGSEDLAAI